MFSLIAYVCCTNFWAVCHCPESIHLSMVACYRMGLCSKASHSSALIFTFMSRWALEGTTQASAPWLQLAFKPLCCRRTEADLIQIYSTLKQWTCASAICCTMPLQVPLETSMPFRDKHALHRITWIVRWTRTWGVSMSQASETLRWFTKRIWTW